MKHNINRPQWLDILLIFITPIMGMALGVAVTVFLKIQQTDYSTLVVNLFFLTACILLYRIFQFSSADLGLKLIKGQTKRHVLLSLGIFTLYILFYIFAVRISALKSVSSSTLWGLLTYLIVVIAEELYFRGIAYGFFEKRLSARSALIITSLLFGLFHARQGLSGILSKTFTGWLWGSVRYSTGMIFLIIFPIHFAYNLIWLLFEGNWNNMPTWIGYAVPAAEFLLGLVIVITQERGFALERKKIFNGSDNTLPSESDRDMLDHSVERQF